MKWKFFAHKPVMEPIRLFHQYSMITALPGRCFFLLSVCLGCGIVWFSRPAVADIAYGYICEDSSWRYLSYEEIADMDAQTACYARNEIYARNGRMFESEELQSYFNLQFWYTPCYLASQFTSEMLNTYEQSNIDLLSQREEDAGGYVTDEPVYSYEPVYAYMDRYDGWAESSDYAVDPDSYLFYDSDRRYLTKAELESLSLQELCYARNEIYARCGALFYSQELSDYFGLKNWYWGYVWEDELPADVLNEYEAYNVELLLETEYAQNPFGYQLDQSYTYAGIGSYTGGATYDATSSDYIFWDSNLRYLSYEDLAGLSLRELCYARNEIYARRGYIFQAQELRDYFSAKTWYRGTVPAADFSSSVFNEYEMANAELLKSFEYTVNPRGYQLY